MQGPQLIMSSLSSLVPISLPNHQGLVEQWLALDLRIHGSSPVNCKIKNLMIRAILMSPNRTKRCVYGYIYVMKCIYIKWIIFLFSGLCEVKSFNE